MRILVISQFYAPDVTAAAYRISETTELLRSAGHEVRVITAVPHKSNAIHSTEEDRLDGVSRVPVVQYRGGGFMSYLVHYFSFVLGAILSGTKVRLGGWRPDVIWVTSPPLFVGLAGWVLSWIMWTRMVLDVRDIWPESAVAAGQIKQDGGAFRIGKLLEKFLYGRAAQISCVSQPMADYIRTRTTTLPSVVYNGVLLDAKEAMPGKVVNRIVYAGNLGRVQGVDVLMRAFAKIRNEGELSDWTVDYIGTGEFEEALRALAVELGCDDCVRFHGVLPKPKALSELARSRALFIHLNDHPVFALTIPSKVFDYMLMDRPILCGVSGEALSILQETGGNVSFASDSVESLAEAIRKLANGLANYERAALANSTLVQSRYSREAATKVLEEILTSVAHGHKAGRNKTTYFEDEPMGRPESPSNNDKRSNNS